MQTMQKMFSSSAPDLQNGLDILHKGTDSRQLSLAPEKCEQLTINRNAVKNQYYIDSNCITNSQCVKDLGVLISKDLKWCSYISRVKSIASTCAYCTLHTFSSKNVWTLLKAYTTYVRPKLEFNISVWSPYLKKDIVSIKSVQKHFTRQICNWCSIPYNSYLDRLDKLNIKSLFDFNV